MDVGGFHEVPLDLRAITSEATSRQISRLQSRHSSVGDETSEPEVLHKTASEKDPKYARFSNKTKHVCLLISAMSGFLAPLSSLTILPAIPEIASRFNTTEEIINVSNAIYCVCMSLSPCIFSPCSDIYGRRYTFLFCSVMFCVSSALVAVSQNLAMFFVFRCMSGFFGTSFFSIGGHIVGDVYHPTQRGRAMAALVAGAQVGTGFGPVFGGIIVNFTSWRVILWVMMGAGAMVMVLAVFFLPETSVQTVHSLVLAEARKTNPSTRFVFVPFNPLRIMKALKYPNLSIDGFIAIATLYTMFQLQTPIRSVLEPRFHLDSPLYSGLFYLAPGMGYVTGSFIGGPWADWTVKRYMKKKGRRVPEDRLRTVLIPLGIMYPVSTMIYGWSIEYKKGGMAVPIIFLFMGGVAQTCIFPASNAYCVDSMPELGGDGIASSYFSRYVAAAVASASCLTSIKNIGLGWTCTITAIVLWIACGCAVVLIIWGEQMRIRALVKAGLRDADDLNSIQRQMVKRHKEI
ncbi:hypothetical protein CANTEDRAFT_119151 [Yamadazyma tenuis ATCC 10573]|uniref:Major facilitator superfamily (MFS) profile domain-containing protein n=2 Tax=Candida tenuis TaxID=2315449 RepID=G3AZ95_CANTC|nr:uncharacterized protein CANTEDRAFT_119151 [Yamadazyma tenuis ATCC 10573]EGV66041.1 hypothetical protein CANTEDRAFT_119151 [Yamadazyma tenuis ATCC 10573]